LFGGYQGGGAAVTAAPPQRLLFNGFQRLQNRAHFLNVLFREATPAVKLNIFGVSSSVVAAISGQSTIFPFVNSPAFTDRVKDIDLFNGFVAGRTA
jgi:hypothetical protein